MNDTIFDLSRTNPNNRALIVPQEEGADEDDRYFGSIGDATQKHIGSLSPANRQLWEGLYTAKSGKIFRFEASPAWSDPDPFSLSGEDLEVYFEKLKSTMKGKMSDEDLAPLREAIEVEQERREKSEDLYDHADPIPYHMLHEYPGMAQHAEIPGAPADKVIFMGDATQLFYDQFAEEHPDAAIINQALSILNKDWDVIDQGFANWFKTWIDSQLCRKETIENFKWLADRLAEGKEDPIDLTEQVLVGIENVWRKDYLKAAEEKTRVDALYQLLKVNQKKWAEEAKIGMTVYGQVKRFGQMLFKEFHGQMKPHHWALYRRIKTEHAPRVMVRGIDINRCDLSKLIFLFEDQNKARKVWLQRPFDSIGVVKKEGYLTRDIFVDDENTEGLLAKMEAMADAGPEALNNFRKELIDAQRKKVYGMISWSPIWAYYHLLKSELQVEENSDGR